MQIYTTYFARVVKLPSTIMPVAICRYPVEGWHYPICRELAPTQEVFVRYKRTHNFERFTQEFVETTLAFVTVQRILTTLNQYADGKDIALVCFEKNRWTCHRSIVGEWLTFNGIPVQEWEPQLDRKEQYYGIL